MLTFSEKIYEHFKIILQHLLKLFRTHYPLKKLSVFDLQDFENFLAWKKCIFEDFSKILEFDLPLNQPVLTKIFQIDLKLTFNVFHILNHDHISKIENYIWWYRTPPKKVFFGGWSGGLKYKDLEYVSGRKEFLIPKCRIIFP